MDCNAEEEGWVTLGWDLELPACTARNACTARHLGEMSRNDPSLDCLAGSDVGLTFDSEPIPTLNVGSPSLAFWLVCASGINWCSLVPERSSP